MTMPDWPLKMKAILRINPTVFACLALFLLAVPAYAGWKDSSQEELLRLVHNGIERSYLLYVPSAPDETKTYPLIIALHGGGGSARSMDSSTGLQAEAHRVKAILVYPNGIGRFKDRLLTWNAGNCCGYALEKQADDVGFISALIDALSKQYPIDPGRIYATGMSNGGKMSYRLACNLSDKIVAIAPVAGSMEVPDCTPKYPVSVMVFHGTADTHILYEGGAPKKSIDKRHPRLDNSVRGAINYWTKHNRCIKAPERTEKWGIVRDMYTDCAGGSGVVLYSILGGGHAWPGGKKWRSSADAPTEALSASRKMVDFFLAHPRK